jgi:hypothetical protein
LLRLVAAIHREQPLSMRVKPQRYIYLSGILLARHAPAAVLRSACTGQGRKMKRVLVANAKGPWFPIWDPGSYSAMLEIGSLCVPASVAAGEHNQSQHSFFIKKVR